jgi:hypothetical protein
MERCEVVFCCLRICHQPLCTINNSTPGNVYCLDIILGQLATIESFLKCRIVRGQLKCRVIRCGHFENAWDTLIYILLQWSEHYAIKNMVIEISLILSFSQ